MILKQENHELLEHMAKTPYGTALKEYLEAALRDIKDISTAQTWEETLGRKFAVKLVEDLFSFMKEKKIVDKSKNQYL